MRLGHAHLKVRNLDRSITFYTDLVGLRVTERLGEDFVFLSFGEEHHDLALQALGNDAPSPPSHATGLFHIAFAVDTDDALRDLVMRLMAAGLPARGADYGISKAVYTQDPDGHGIEFYRDTRADTGLALWHGRTQALKL